MKLFDVSWSDVLQGLSRWYALSPDARRTMLDTLTLSGWEQASYFEPHLEEIVASGIAVCDPARKRVMLAEPHRALMKVLRAMGRQPVFHASAPSELVKYIEEHYSQDDLQQLGERSAGFFVGHVARATLAARVGFAGWSGDLLVARTDAERLAWAEARGRMPSNGATTKDLLELQGLARALLERGQPVPLRELTAPLSARQHAVFSRALHLGLGTLVLFVGMRQTDLEPLLGLWPDALAELTRPPVSAPTVVEPVEQFALAVLMEDMTAVLATVAATPVRLRANDLAVFARVRVEIESRLVALPSWAADVIHEGEQVRVDRAAMELLDRRFVTRLSLHHLPHLEITRAGTKWLATSPRDRLAALLDPMRASTEKNPAIGYFRGPEQTFFPFTIPYHNEPKSLNLRQALTQAFLELPEGFVAIAAFLDHAGREANPFAALPKAESQTLFRNLYYGTGDARSVFANLWSNALHEFILERLVMLGGARLGILANGAPCFMLTDIGRYLLGATDLLDYGAVERAEVVVQPNFDIVFMGAAPVLEARMTRVAERVGVAPGLAFRLTKASVLRAAESGATVDEVLAILADASSKPIPKNVQREIAGWVGSVRRGRLRRIEVIDCADADSADRVVAVLGSKVSRLTPTMVAIDAGTTQARAAVLKRLRAGGVFLTDESGKQAASGKKRRQPPDIDALDWE